MEPKDSPSVVTKISNYKLSWVHWIHSTYSHSTSARSTLIYRCYLVTSLYVGKLNNLIHSYGNHFSFRNHTLSCPIQSHKGYLKYTNAWEQNSTSLLFLNVNWDFQSISLLTVGRRRHSTFQHKQYSLYPASFRAHPASLSNWYTGISFLAIKWVKWEAHPSLVPSVEITKACRIICTYPYHSRRFLNGSVHVTYSECVLSIQYCSRFQVFKSHVIPKQFYGQHKNGTSGNMWLLQKCNFTNWKRWACMCLQWACGVEKDEKCCLQTTGLRKVDKHTRLHLAPSCEATSRTCVLCV